MELLFFCSKKTVQAAENNGHLTSGLCMQAISSLLTFPSFSYHTAFPGWLIKLHCKKNTLATLAQLYNPDIGWLGWLDGVVKMLISNSALSI
jgi:hypothetical protein